MAADRECCEILCIIVTLQPSLLGYLQEGWSASTLREHIEESLEIRISDRRFRQVLHRLHIHYQRVPVIVDGQPPRYIYTWKLED